jgi:uncharacterized membrane-anchored protein
MNKYCLLALIGLVILPFSAVAQNQNQLPSPPGMELPLGADPAPLNPQAEEMARIYQQARMNQIPGPRELDLDGVAVLNLPLGYSFMSTQDARALMNLMNNPIDEGMLGMVVATNDLQMDWFMVLSHTPVGFISDKSAKFNADHLLATIRDTLAQQIALLATEEQKKYHVDRVNWILPPRYDKVTRRLEWVLDAAVSAVPESDPSGRGLNFQQIKLYRGGFISMNLATTEANLQSAISNGVAISRELSFVEGKRYEQYQSGDPLANLDISMLVAGKKAGADSINHDNTEDLSLDQPANAGERSPVLVVSLVLLALLLALVGYLRWLRRLEMTSKTPRSQEENPH